jgi:hypothetical protein
MAMSVWLTRGDHLRAIQLNRTDLKSLVIHGNSHLYYCQKPKNKPHVRPNWSWLGPIATEFLMHPAFLDGTSLAK